MSWRAWGAFAALGIIWACQFFIKLALQEAPPVVVAFGRVALSAAILLPIARASRRASFAGRHKYDLAFALVEFVLPFPDLRRSVDQFLRDRHAHRDGAAVGRRSDFGVRERLGWWRFGLGLGFVGVALLGFTISTARLSRGRVHVGFTRLRDRPSSFNGISAGSILRIRSPA